MSSRFTLLFYFKKPKNYSKDLQPLYMRVTVGIERFEVSTKRKWDPLRWNAETCRASGTKEDARSLNAYLHTFETRLNNAHLQLLADSEAVTAQSLRMRFEGKQSSGKMLLEIFRDHNLNLRQLVNKDFAYSTL
jgi:hypothetical protein